MYNYTIQYLKLLYRITIISSTLNLLNKQKIFTMKFIFNVLSTSAVFLISMIINDKLNDKLKEKYKNWKDNKYIIPILVGPIIISVLYIIRHTCVNYVCKSKI